MQANRNERRFLFSDAVIGITLTLLVLDLRLPAAAEGMDDARLRAALAELGPSFQAYPISFLVIALFWTGHREKFEVIRRSSAGLIWLNLLFLLRISWMPFAAQVLAENGGRLATMLFAAVVAMVALVSATMSVHAVRAGLLDTAAPTGRSWRLAQPSLATALVFLLSSPLALIGPYVAQWSRLLLVPLRLLINRVPAARPAG